MSGRNLSVRNLRALRLIRAGLPFEQVCQSLQLSLAAVRGLESALRSVPDDLLVRLEQTLLDNEKLRRLVARLDHASFGTDRSESA